MGDIKERRTYEEMYTEKVREINLHSGTTLELYRQNLIAWEKATIQSKGEADIKDSRRRYLHGLQMRVIRPLLAYIKKRKATLNRVIHNGGNSNFYKRFYECAFDSLSLCDFQYIMGKACTKLEIEQQTIEDLRDFLIECQKVTRDQKR